ncbi:HNH endonuclease [Streptomyces azureus]|uniref:Endonuclease n=1 Tax=Streptomyces azureus TaxID=146537 RepID=A0A0K8PGB9_STRAJ|nr:HNH endonuclease [Streptomyces azureus]GAP46927.1 endonuclease [Streptomyces azureus]
MTATVQPALDGSVPEPRKTKTQRQAEDYETWLAEVPGGLNGHALAKPFVECSNSGCDREAAKRGMCEMHYQRWKAEFRRAGLPLPAAPPRPTWSADLTGNRPYDKQYREATKHRLIANSVEDPHTGCWIWQKALDRDGYGVCGAPKRESAHRASFLAFIGPIPAGMVIDHRCHSNAPTCPGGTDCMHRRCINPAHLEPVTDTVNVLRGRSTWAKNARKTHCHRGHEFTPENTYARPDGRACRACQNAASAAYKRRRKEVQR